MKRVSSSLRGFLRYLHLSGRMQVDLSRQVAAPRVYQLESVPRARPWAQVLSLLRGADRRTAIGRRDYAIVLLLICYGLRAGEVAKLSLEDLDWERGQLNIRNSKNGESRLLPLHALVGNAIIAYLKNGRPSSRQRAVFLKHRAPIGPFERSDAVVHAVKRHARRAGVTDADWWTAHVIRHSYATHLLRERFSLKAIGDALGHRSATSTLVYTKVNIDELRGVALDTSGVAA